MEEARPRPDQTALVGLNAPNRRAARHKDCVHFAIERVWSLDVGLCGERPVPLLVDPDGFVDCPRFERRGGQAASLADHTLHS
jgi:hypothetical protein